MKKHIWIRHRLVMNGKWQHFLTVLQVWKCKNCGIEKDRPDDDSRPSEDNCLGGKKNENPKKQLRESGKPKTIPRRRN